MIPFRFSISSRHIIGLSQALIIFLSVGAAQAQDTDLRTQQLFVKGQRLETAKIEIPKLVAQLKQDAEAARAGELARLKTLGGMPTLGADRPFRQFKLRVVEIRSTIKGLLTNPPEIVAPQLMEMAKPAPGETELASEDARLLYRASVLEINKALQWADTINERLASEAATFKSELTKP